MLPDPLFQNEKRREREILIAAAQTRIHNFESSAKLMREDADAACILAEKKNDMSLLAKANKLRSGAKELDAARKTEEALLTEIKAKHI